MHIEKEKPQEGTDIKKVVAIMSGKGGVGKSSVTSLMAVSLQNKGYKVGILDADITGPSIPKVFGIGEKRAVAIDNVIQPVETTTGIKVISINLMMDQEDSPVVWRGPLIASMVKQFYTDVAWGELDYLLIDLPPGTGDVPLTIMQSLPVDGIVVVSCPQDLVQLIVKKSVNMARMMATPIYGLVENMSYFQCPDCDKKHYIFGESNIEEVAKEMDMEVLEKLPINQDFVTLCDEGRVEIFGKTYFGLCEQLAEKLEERIGGMEK
ncbi:MAG: Mrp/NBP35 family ATP-binding protein [Anaeromicrobium sp.]|uniref:Mrp/NBP35 family ATP-binding protein n=1 Tax=Anaeromicrobium sp. TaxID=1929132 RepID=UPI0025E0246A|nr:Mrp/NBP35 family ATP-binding protein [Anaeromicrobium sp.]MCT4595868.1 Mrp/NBP35 family ATP-binding protein [Anaeromicrobium sp.]